MKKIFTSIVFALMVVLASAQCVPDVSITTPGYYPDSATGLPHDTVGIPYTAVIQVRIPATVMVGTLTANVDSFHVDGINGLPAGFSFTCTPSSCTFPSVTNGCVQITGTSNASQVGTYPLQVLVTGYGTILSFPASIQDTVFIYSIVVEQSTGIPSLSYSRFDVAQNYPNPFSKKSSIVFSSTGNEKVSVEIHNLLGKVLYSRSVNSKQGLNYVGLEARDYPPGVYTYSLSNGKSTITKRMIVVKE